MDKAERSLGQEHDLELRPLPLQVSRQAWGGTNNTFKCIIEKY